MVILQDLLLFTSLLLLTGATPQNILVHPGATSGANIHFHLGIPGQGGEGEGGVKEGQVYQKENLDYQTAVGHCRGQSLVLRVVN